MSILILGHKVDLLRYDLTSSVLVPFGTTGRVYLKSPASKTVTPPINLLFPLISFRDIFKALTPPLCAIVISSHTIIFVFFKTYAKLLCFNILQKGVTEVVRLSGNLKVAWAVRPPSSSVAAIPEDATDTV